MAIAPTVKDSSPQRPLVGLEKLPHDSWVRVAAFAGQKVACCSRVSKCIHNAFKALGTTLWHEHHLANFGSIHPGQDWQVRFRESGHSLQMGMRVKIPSVRETGNITGCVVEGDQLVVAKIEDLKNGVSSVTWSDLRSGATEKRELKGSLVYSLAFQHGVFATVSKISSGDRLNLWRQGGDPASLTTLDIAAFQQSDARPDKNINCRIGHGKVLLSGRGRLMTSGLSLIDLETGKTLLPFTHNRDPLNLIEGGICGVYNDRALLMDPHTVLAAHVYYDPRFYGSPKESFTKLHVWDVRVGFHQAAVQTYVAEERWFCALTLNSCGEIVTTTKNVAREHPGGSSRLSIWDRRTQKRSKVVQSKDDLGAYALTSMGNTVVSGSSDGVVRCWESSKLRLLDKWVMPNHEKTVVHGITASSSICLFLTQEVSAERRHHEPTCPSSLWQATALTFAPPVDANAASAAAAAPSPMAAAGAGAGAAAR